MEISLHSVCRWTFHAGKGGFVPSDSIPSWDSDSLDTVGMIRLVKERIQPRLPDFVQLGIELHYDNEVNEQTADEVSAAMLETGIYLAMLTPGAHSRFAYGGIASLDPDERSRAECAQTGISGASGAGSVPLSVSATQRTFFAAQNLLRGFSVHPNLVQPASGGAADVGKLSQLRRIRRKRSFPL